jgi:hypothetical protein
MSDPTAKLKTSKEQEMKMEKNSLELMDKAMAILKAEFGDRHDLALATMVGYASAAVDLKAAQFILSLVENRGN